MMNRQSQRNPLRRFPARSLRRSTGAEDSRPESPEERPPLRLRRRERSSSDVETLRVWLAQDKAKDPKAQEKRFFRAAKRVERQYGTQLRKIARHVGDLVKALIGDDPFHTEQITAALNQYSETIEPWAASVANRMIAEVNARDYEQWAAISQAIGAGIRETISSPGMVGETWRELQREQVALITSLPREAAQRVQDLASKAMTEGTRAEHLVKDILETGDVTVSRAKTIARTEVSRTKANLTEARAIAAGSSRYRWRTAGDSDVRPSHRALNGKVFRWDDPPECDPGYHANPGCIFNCRCIAIPIFDDEE